MRYDLETIAPSPRPSKIAIILIFNPLSVFNRFRDPNPTFNIKNNSLSIFYREHLYI